TMYIYAGRFGLILLFLLNACYVFAALGLFSFGIVAVPCVLLGRLGVLTVTSDLAPTALLLISCGVLFLGAGMSFGIIPLCSASYGVYGRFVKKASVRRERMFNEEDTIS
ncbi:MAG: hypothetical protein IK093_06710, partial [Ruminiclostridium sp.]|nr:hypothetical protein [Ruminiclostridium sp.]